MFLWRALKTKDIVSALKSIKTGSTKVDLKPINSAVNVKAASKLRINPARQRLPLLTVSQSATTLFQCIGLRAESRSWRIVLSEITSLRSRGRCSTPD